MRLCDQVLALARKQPMTTEEIVKELRIARSTINNAIKELKDEGLICITRYEYTGVKPVAYWGAGNVDAPRPSIQSAEERNARRRERRRLDRERAEQLAKAREFKPRRDIAASWIPRM